MAKLRQPESVAEHLRVVRANRSGAAQPEFEDGAAVRDRARALIDDGKPDEAIDELERGGLLLPEASIESELEKVRRRHAPATWHQVGTPPREEDGEKR